MGRRGTEWRWMCILSAVIAAGAQAQQDPTERFIAKPQQTATARVDSAEIDVPGSQHWVDSGIDLRPGDRARITVTGKLQYSGANENGPEGFPRGFRDLIRNMPVNEAGRGAAVARIGDAESSLAFLVGASKEIRASVAGRLFVGINQGSNDQAEGGFHVKVEVLERAASNAPASGSGSANSASASSGTATQQAAPLQSSAQTSGATARGTAPAQEAAPAQPAQLPADVFDKIPGRIRDKDGNPGDMVNFLILGSEDQVKQAFQAAGWVQVDRTAKEAALHGLLASLSKEAYTNMPMSELYLFGRAQDYGFAHAEPISVAMTRHHLRLWKAPFTVHGQTLWVGAATHDIGFERDQRNKGITHKIDPAVDEERSYVEQTLSQTGLFSSVAHATPPNPLTEAKTATGGSFHSDGRVLVLTCTAAGK